MTIKLAVINGKRMRAPSLERLDAMQPRADASSTPIQQDYDPRAFKAGLFDKDAPRTWASDKAELVAFGVNGEVALAEAAKNAGMTTLGQQGGVRFANKTGLWRLPSPANDNHKIAAVAA